MNGVSVVMPTYNGQKTISYAIESVIKQTFKNWELIVVDDGSKDDTKSIVEGFGDERIHYIYQNNAGPAAARNNGIENSKMDYIAFMDSDDIIHQDYLKTLLEIIQMSDADISMCQYEKAMYVTAGDKEAIETKRTSDIQSFKLTDLTADSSINRMFIKKEVMPYPFLKLFKRSVIGDSRFPTNLKLGEDMEFNLSVMKKATKIVLTDSILYYHLENSASITHNFKSEVATGHFHQFKRLLETETKYYKAIESRMFVVAFDFLSQMNKRENLEFYNECKSFVKEHRNNVYNYSENSKTVHMISLMSRISIGLTIVFCKLGKKFNKKKAV